MSHGADKRRAAEAAQVGDQHAESFERLELRLPHGAGHREGVDQDDDGRPFGSPASRSASFISADRSSTSG